MELHNFNESFIIPLKRMETIMKKITVIAGSPRKDGNSDLLAY